MSFSITIDADDVKNLLADWPVDGLEDAKITDCIDDVTNGLLVRTRNYSISSPADDDINDLGNTYVKQMAAALSLNILLTSINLESVKISDLDVDKADYRKAIKTAKENFIERAQEALDSIIDALNEPDDNGTVATIPFTNLS